MTDRINMAEGRVTVDGVASADPQPGTELYFDNGGRIDVHMVEDGWVYYAVYLPSDTDDPQLCRRRMADWHKSLAFTRKQIAEGTISS